MVERSMYFFVHRKSLGSLKTAAETTVKLIFKNLLFRVVKFSTL